MFGINQQLSHDLTGEKNPPGCQAVVSQRINGDLESSESIVPELN